MKNIFSILLICCATLAFADEPPVFEEVEEQGKETFCAVPFAAEEFPTFEEEEETVADNDEVTTPEEEETVSYATSDKQDNNTDKRHAIGLPIRRPAFENNKDDQDKIESSYFSWKRYRSNFGMEKITARFPQKPAYSQSNSLLTAYSYDHAVMYSLSGYFPPIGNIDPCDWFDEILYNVTNYPYELISHVTYQVSCGDWVMDYIAHDYVQNLVIKARAIVTPFNGYILQCVKPNGTKDYFDYFVDNFWIKCECQ